MAHTVTRPEDLPVIILSYDEPFDAVKEPLQVLQAIAAAQAEIDGRVFTIHDVTKLSLSFSDVVMSLASSFLSQPPKGFNRSRIRPMMISTDGVARMWVNGAQQEQYGRQNWQLFTSREEALEEVRRQLVEM